MMNDEFSPLPVGDVPIIRKGWMRAALEPLFAVKMDVVCAFSLQARKKITEEETDPALFLSAFPITRFVILVGNLLIRNEKEEPWNSGVFYRLSMLPLFIACICRPIQFLYSMLIEPFIEKDARDDLAFHLKDSLGMFLRFLFLQVPKSLIYNACELIRIVMSIPLTVVTAITSLSTLAFKKSSTAPVSSSSMGAADSAQFQGNSDHSLQPADVIGTAHPGHGPDSTNTDFRNTHRTVTRVD